MTASTDSQAGDLNAKTFNDGMQPLFLHNMQAKYVIDEFYSIEHDDVSGMSFQLAIALLNDFPAA